MDFGFTFLGTVAICTGIIMITMPFMMFTPYQFALTGGMMITIISVFGGSIFVIMGSWLLKEELSEQLKYFKENQFGRFRITFERKRDEI